MSTTEDLVAWLLEQIAEDEAIARALPESPRLGGRPSRPGETYRGPSYGLSAFIRTISPARVLAECESKREIVKLSAYHLEAWRLQAANPERVQFIDVEARGRHSKRTLELLALPYVDRPGYRDEWRP